MHVYLIVAAAVWGTASGLLLPRAAYRLAVEGDEPWAAACPAGHPLPGGPRGWLGPARCQDCTAALPADPSAAPAPHPAGLAGAFTDLPPAPADPAGAPTDEPPAPTDDPPALTPTGQPPTPRYGLGYGAAFACALACAALGFTVGAHPELVVWLLLVPVGMVLARVDLLVFRLPDVLTLPALGATAVLLGSAALLPAHDGSWVRALIAGAGLGVLYLVLFFINPAGMGFGDVKLAPTMGLVLGWYGWPTVFTGTFAGFALGGLTGLVLIASRRANRKTPIPFGPFMLIGTLGALLLATA